jgi:hypothetical protein
MIETLLGGLLGGAFRLAPEVLKWLDRKGERGHELAMQDKALEFEKIRGAQRMAEIGASAEAAWNTGAIEALREAVRTQGEKTGVAGRMRCRPACGLSSPTGSWPCTARPRRRRSRQPSMAGRFGAWRWSMPGRMPIRRCGPEC